MCSAVVACCTISLSMGKVSVGAMKIKIFGRIKNAKPNGNRMDRAKLIFSFSNELTVKIGVYMKKKLNLTE